MTHPQAPETPGVAELAALLAQGRFMFLRMAHALISADVDVAGWGQRTQDLVTTFAARGHRIKLELFTDKSGGAIVALVAISPNGDREELGRVAEDAPGAAN